jgi:hypothetical protein
MTNPEKGITKWVDEMKHTAFYAILSGFEIGEVPGVGTYYDFFKRLWAQVRSIFAPSEGNVRPSPRKGKRRVKKPPTLHLDMSRVWSTG